MAKSNASKTPSPTGQSRVDRWLWAVRLFKTRSQAAEAVRTGRVRVDGKTVKASRMVQAGDEVSLRKGPVTYRYRVIQALEKRVGAPLVVQYMEDITPQEERDKLLTIRTMPTAFRERGTGRPTKRERREIDGLGEAIGSSGSGAEGPQDRPWMDAPEDEHGFEDEGDWEDWED